MTILLIFLITACKSINQKNLTEEQKPTAPGSHYSYSHGAIVRGDTASKEIALVFTGDEYGEGGEYILGTLENHKIKASFFLTGNFYRNNKYGPLIRELSENGNYMGSHSDKHLLYCAWENRDSLLISKNDFGDDIVNSFTEMSKFGISSAEAAYFLPPYEWYNDSIALWAAESGLQLVNFTGGTRSNADYTYPGMGARYVDSKTIYTSIMSYERKSDTGLNGFILLTHIGTDPRRTDKFYFYLPQLIGDLKDLGYKFVRIDELLK